MKRTLLLCTLQLITLSCFSQSEVSNNTHSTVVGTSALTDDILATQTKISYQELRNVSQPKTVKHSKGLYVNLEGSYQIISKNKDTDVEMSPETLAKIEDSRHFSEVVFLEVSADTKIKILPFRSVMSPNFEPINRFHHEK